MAIFQVIDTADGGDTREEGFQKDAANWAIAESALSAATTKILVGGGVGTAPVMTTATGTGAPVRANSPTLVTPVLGAATGTSVIVTGAITASAGNIEASAGSVITDTIAEKTSAAGVTIDGVKLKDGGALVVTGGTNTFNLTNGTASLDVAAGAAVNIDKGLTVNGTDSGTLAFSAAGKTLTIAGDATISSTPVSPVGTHSIWIPANQMTSRTTNGAAAGSAEMGTYKNMLETRDFDAATDEFVQFCIEMPKSWNEDKMGARFVWSHTTGASAYKVSWWIQAVAVGDGDALDVSYGTPIESEDTGGTADTCYISPPTAVTISAGTGLGTNEYIMFQVLRDVSDANDTLDIDARLHGVQLYYTTDAGTDD